MRINNRMIYLSPLAVFNLLNPVRMKTFFTVALALITGSGAVAQSPKIENFSLPDAVTGKSVALNDYAKSVGVVLVFTSNHCAYAKLYEDRLLELARQYQAQGVQFLFINPNTSLDHIDDSVEEMSKRAQEKKYPSPYLADKEHKAAGLFRATKTPEVFVLGNTGGVFTLKYHGAIDDNPQMAGEVKTAYLKGALDALVGKRNPAQSEVRPTGCMIHRE